VGVARRYAVAQCNADRPKSKVLGADVAVVEQTRLFVREHKNPACPIGEAFNTYSAPCVLGAS
jgi:hypothetical protein